MSTIDLGGFSGSENYSGFIDNTDPFDIFKFSLSKPGNFQISLGQISENADVELLNSNGDVLYSSNNSGTSLEEINIDNLAAGYYSVRVFQVSGDTNYNLSLAVGEKESTSGTNGSVDPITGLNIESGYFIVGQTGEVGVDFINDGGEYKGELAIFSLVGMDKFAPGSAEFIKEAARRSLSNSELGYMVISDPAEGAKFSVGLGDAKNDGPYQSVKKFGMKPGDKFGTMLVPNGTVQQIFENPALGGSKRPLFSLVTANPNEAFHVGQIADINGTGSVFAIEDQRVDTGTDKDYNDVIFKLTGATGKAVNLDEVINPEKDWRDSNLGKDLIDYVKKEELAIDPKSPIDTTPVDPKSPIDTTPIDPKSPIDTTPVDPKPPVDTIPVDPKPPIDITPVDPKPPIDITPVDPTPIYNAGNTLATALDLGTLRVNASEISYSLGVRDFVNNVDRYDYYRFNFEDTNNFNLRLDDLSADAKVELIQDLNNNNQVDEGEVLEISDGGTASQVINRTPLNKGIYYVRVSPGEAGETNYCLNLTASLPEVSIAPHQPLIGIIDTGFSGNNADLDYRRFKLGSDRISNDNDPLLSFGEGNEHGTHILGLIAATQGNEIGIDGINDKAPIWLGRAIGSGNWAESLIEFVDAAKESGQKNAVVNLSLDLTQVNPDGSVTTRYELTPKEREAIEYARQNHVLIVTAAGNDGGVMSVLGQASQEFDNIITVGASNGSDRTNYSSYGAGLDIVTEGGTIDNPVISTVKDSLGKMAGTSVAAAKVTGVASLVWAANPDLNFKQVISILESTATDLKTPGWDGETGFGLLNSAAAVELAKNTVGENYTPEPWAAPFIWDGEGKVTPTERAAEGGISIATAPQFSPTFSDNDKVDSATPEKYYQFTVSQPGYVRWTLTRTNGSNEFPGADLVKADSTSGRFKFVPGGPMLSGTVVGQTPPISITNGVFVDPGTYYLKLRGGTNNTVQNYNLSNQFIPDSISTFQTPINYSTTPYFDFKPDIQSKAFNGSSATGLNVSGQVEYKLGDLSKQIAKYGLEVKETGKLNFNVLSPNGKVEVRVEKFIGSEDKTDNLAYYEFAANANYSNEITLNKGRYQIEIKANGDEVSDLNQILQLPYTLKGVFSRLAPKVGEGNVPIGAGNFIKTVTSNGVDTHYYTNGHLSVQPKGYSTWYASSTNTATPILGGTITPLQDTVKKYSFEYYYGNGTFLNGQYTGGGDYYKGYVYALDGTYLKNQIIAQPTFNSSGYKGFYKITDASLSGSVSDVGKVYLTFYSDNDTSKGIFKPNNNVNYALGDGGLGTEYDFIGTQFFDKDTELDLRDNDGNTSMSTSEYLPLNQTTSWKWIGGGFDREDYYRFSLNQINDVNIQFDGLSAKAGFKVIKDLNNNLQVDPGETLNISSGSTTPQTLSTTFAPGNYYICVFPESPNDLNGKTSYNLRVSANPEIAGNTFGQAYNVGILNRSSYKKYTGFLRTNHDIDDYYQFQLDKTSNVSLKLDGLNTIQLGSVGVEGATPSTLIQLIRDTNNNGQVDAGEALQSASGNSTTNGLINTSLEPSNYFVRVSPETSNSVNTSYNLNLYAEARPIPLNHWNASFINRNPDNVADFNSYDFSNPTAVLDLGSQSSGDGKIRLYKDFGLNSPAFNVQNDNFAMEASTTTRLEAGKLYKVTTKSDDGTQFFLTKVGSATTRKNLEQLGGWSNGDWRDRGADEPAKTIYFKVPESGDYVFDVQYYEKGIGSKIDVSLEPHQPFPDDTDTAKDWHSEFFWWDRTKGDKPPVDFSTDRSNVIGSIDQGSNDLGGGKKGINFNWGNGLPKNKDNNIDDRLPGDYFAISSYTQAHFDAGKKYRFTVRGDDGFKLLAKNWDLPDSDLNKWVYITPKDQWQQSYGETVYEFTLPQNAPTGWYDLHFHFYEQGGDANFNLSWEEVPPPQKPDIKIELVDHYGQFTPSQWAKIQQAAANWERIITKDKDSSGILKISVNQGQTDDPKWFADTYEDKAFNYRNNIDKPDVDLDGVDYHNNIRFNTSKLSEAEKNNLLVRVAMHEIGNALGLPDDNDSPNLMHHEDFNGIITETMYSRLEERGYSVDRNAVVDWERSNNSGGGGSSGTPLIAIQGADYFTARPQFYTTGNAFFPNWTPDPVGGQMSQRGVGYYTGNCTWYAFGRVKELGGKEEALRSMIGNAGTWGDNLSNGSQIVNQPQIGDIAEWVNDGHVAVVEQVNSDGSIVISESNFGYDHKLHHIRTIYPGQVGSLATGWPDRFIRVPKVSDTANPVNGNSNSDDGNPDSGNPGSLLGGSITPSDPNGKPSPYYATDLGTLNGRFIRSGDIGNTYDYGKDEKDYYSFKVDKDNTRVNLSLERLSGQIWDASLELRDENGSLLYSSIYDIGRTFKKGTYYVGVSSIGSAKTDYKLRLVKLSGDIENRGLSDFDIDGGYTARHPDGVQLYRYNKDGRTTYNNIDDDSIEPNKDTVVVIHGWQDSDEGGEIQALLRTVAITHPSYQVLALNWHDPASDPRDFLFPFHSARSIQPVAQWAADTLEALGIKPNQISLLGHSLGSYVSAEIGRIFNEDKHEGKVKNLVAFDPANAFDLSDPANVGGRIYDIDGNKLNKQRVTDFNQVATKSLSFVAADWAFPVTTPLSLTSIAGDNDRAGTAHDSFVIRYYRSLTPIESYDPGKFHKGTIDVFTDALSKGFLSFPNLTLPGSLQENWYDNAGDKDNWLDRINRNYGKHEGIISVNLNSGDTWDLNGKNPWRIKQLEYVKDSFGNTAKDWFWG